MLVRHLSYFVTLARMQHFARAAEACHVTQSTLSAAIRKLEEDLQVTLVVRSQRFLGLTVEGEHLLAWSRQILTDYDSLREDLSGLRAGLKGTLRLGVIPAAMGAVGVLTARFCEAHPEALVEIRALSSREIQKGLDSFEIEAGLTYLENEPLDRVRRVPLYHERYILAMRADHALAGRGRVAWAEVAGHRLRIAAYGCLIRERAAFPSSVAKLGQATGRPGGADIRATADPTRAPRRLVERDSAKDHRRPARAAAHVMSRSPDAKTDIRPRPQGA